MGKISTGIKNTFFKDDFRYYARGLTIVKDILIILCIINSIIGFIICTSGNTNQLHDSLNFIKWSAIIALGLYLLGVLYDIKNFPLKLIIKRIFMHEHYAINLHDKIVNMLIKNPKINISYIIEYSPENKAFYPVYIINNRKWIECANEHHDIHYSDLTFGSEHIYYDYSEEDAIKRAHNMFDSCNRKALYKLETLRNTAISQKDDNINNINIQLSLKEKYSIPVQFKANIQ